MVPFPLTSRLLHRRKNQVKKAGFVGESPFPFPLASPQSWIWLSLLKSRLLGTELLKLTAAALESVLLTAGSELRELGVVVNP